MPATREQVRDLWREPEALALEGAALQIEEALTGLNNAVELLDYRGRGEVVTVARGLMGHLRSERSDLLGEAERLRAAAGAL